MSHCSTTVPAEIFLGYLIERKGGMDAYLCNCLQLQNPINWVSICARTDEGNFKMLSVEL